MVGEGCLHLTWELFLISNYQVHFNSQLSWKEVAGEISKAAESQESVQVISISSHLFVLFDEFDDNHIVSLPGLGSEKECLFGLLQSSEALHCAILCLQDSETAEGEGSHSLQQIYRPNHRAPTKTDSESIQAQTATGRQVQPMPGKFYSH